LQTAKTEILNTENENPRLGFLNATAEIVKLRITVLVSFTTALGYILAVDIIGTAVIFAPLGIFLLACGSAAINHYQEKSIDKLMSRTNKRPLPTGEVKPDFVLTLSAGAIISGSIILFIFTNLTTLIIGLVTLFWYNVIYTPLKRKTALAVIPGSLVGALPPLAGWAAGGGNIFDFNIIYVSLYFFLWQIPHFWLLLIVYGDDYKKAGFPVLNDVFGIKMLKLLTAFWIILSMFFAAGTSFAGIINNEIIRYILVTAAGFVTFFALSDIKKEISNKNTFRLFIAVNSFTLLYIFLLYTDKIVYLVKLNGI